MIEKTNLVVASLYIMVFSRKCHELRCQWFITCLFQMERLIFNYTLRHCSPSECD